MPRIHQVEITRHEADFKGTWYRTGQRHFVQEQPGWPRVYANRWHALTPGTWGGIDESDCRVLRGPVAWLRCQWFRLTARDASWARPMATSPYGVQPVDPWPRPSKPQGR